MKFYSMKKLLYVILAVAGFSAVSCQKSDGIGTLQTPDGVKAVLEETSITVTWNAVPEAEAYIVHYNMEASTSYSKSGLLTQTSFTLGNCNTGVTYEFKVRAANNSAVSEFSEIVKVSVPKPDGPELAVDTPVVTNVRTGLGWINFTLDNYNMDCSYVCYDGETALASVPELIGSDETAGTSEYSLGGLDLGKTYDNLSIRRVIEGLGESASAAFGSVTTGKIEVLKRNPSPCHLAFEWDDVAGNANWTFIDTDPLTRTYKVELARDEAFENIVYSIYTVNNYDSAKGTYYENNWIGQSGTPADPEKPYANSNTNIVFGQLEPATTYYFRVRNAAGETVPNLYAGSGEIELKAATGKSTWSAVVSATTEPAHVPAAGEILWQGFDDHAIQFDHINCAAGVVHAGVEITEYKYPWAGEWGVLIPSTGKRYDEIGAAYIDTFSGNGESKLDGLAVYKIIDGIIPSMNGWHCAKACYPQQGALKLGGSAGQKNYIITPPFKDVDPNTAVTIGCRAGAAHASSAPAKLHIKVYRIDSKQLETVATIDLPASAYILSPYNNGYHNVVDMEDYSVDTVLQPGDYIMFEAETIKDPATNRLVIDNISVVKK